MELQEEKKVTIKMKERQSTGGLLFQEGKTYRDVPMSLIKKISCYDIVTKEDIKDIFLDDMTKATLIEYAAGKNIDIANKKTKAEILDAIKAAEKPVE